MKTLEYNYVDKSAWGPGEWQDEPDKVQWRDEETGLPCLIVRGPSGALCGYVGVGREHPLFQVEYTAVEGYYSEESLYEIGVHGGLTFSEFCRESTNGHGICHLVEDGEDDKAWWFGFDCAHCDDITPYSRVLMRDFYEGVQYGDYRNLAYVRSEVQSLARQLKAITQ